MTEQRYLSLSLAATLFVAAFGVIMGLASGSSAIVFDGIYSVVDSGMTLLALLVSHLILRATSAGRAGRRLGERFNMGLWHLEPLVVLVDGFLLVAIAIYAFVNGVKGILAGGQAVELGPALVYAGVTLVVCVTMAVFGRLRNRVLVSDLVALDTKGWIMSGGVTAALLIAFAIARPLRGSEWEWFVPYVDPLALSVVALAILPVPLRELAQAVREVLLVTPAALRAEVDGVAARVAREQGFLGYRAYVAEFGKATQIELYFLVPPGAPPRPLEHWDALRDAVGAAIGGDERHRWLTVAFTADPEWAE